MTGVILSVTPDRFKAELQHRLLRECRIAYFWGPYTQKYVGRGSPTYIEHTLFRGILTMIDRTQPDCPVLLTSEFHRTSVPSYDEKMLAKYKDLLFEEGDKIKKSLEEGPYKITVLEGEYKLPTKEV